MEQNDSGIAREVPAEVMRLLTLATRSHKLYSLDRPLLQQVMKTAAASKNKRSSGRRRHPFNFRRVFDLVTANPWHSTCVTTKVAAHVGLGMRSDKVFETLDPICEPETGTGTFGGVLDQACEDYHSTGNGYIEVVRDGEGENAPISGLHHGPTQSTYVSVDAKGNRYFEVEAESGTDSGKRLFAPFGETERLRESGLRVIGELIPFMKPSAFSRDYGFPSWLSAVPFIELVQALVQHKFDFFMNRGVPEFLLTVLSEKQIDKDNWAKLEAALQMNVGLARAFQSVIWNMVGAADKNKVQVDRLGVGEDEAGQMFVSHIDPCALAIVSAHGVPPLLAGIQIPGKLGASNELVQAMASFQVLTMGPDQRRWSNVLANTLGNPTRNGNLGLTEEDFRPKADEEEPHKQGNGFRTILEDVASAMQMLNVADTVARMREGVDAAAAGGRDLGAGVLSQRRTATPGAVARDAGALLGVALRRLAEKNGSE